MGPRFSQEKLFKINTWKWRKHNNLDTAIRHQLVQLKDRATHLLNSSRVILPRCNNNPAMVRRCKDIHHHNNNLGSVHPWPHNLVIHLRVKLLFRLRFIVLFPFFINIQILPVYFLSSRGSAAASRGLDAASSSSNRLPAWT